MSVQLFVRFEDRTGRGWCCKIYERTFLFCAQKEQWENIRVNAYMQFMKVFVAKNAAKFDSAAEAMSAGMLQHTQTRFTFLLLHRFRDK